MLRDIVSNELFTIFIMLGLVNVAITKLIAPHRFNDFVVIIGNSKYLKIYSRDQKFFDKFDALLFFNLILSTSIFILLLNKQLTGIVDYSLNQVLKLPIGIAVIILIKVFIERLIGSLFEIDKLIDQYLFQKITYKNYLGILLIPINAILLYSFTPSLIFIYSIIIFLLIINILGIIGTIKNHESLIKGNFFYFILYLCTLEIAPYIFLFKMSFSK
ncbi:DUF4271 domain-containing protein [Gaetbulibacter saemankumensis]|uniref:DUF4271 domain-containing protein n=1 Tax=Gaetbulibacter saemankumensis TaxID=311208 RepID=UPI000429B860|nr:DUF4271 domain-containing protein [Gaetbulibacter saemankumensis]